MGLPVSNLEYMDDTIKNNRLVVPDYQRGISWEAPEVMDLMDDIMDVYNNKEDKHFLGQIVTYQENDEKMIVDGQQRLSASVLFYASIKSIARYLTRQYQEAEQLTDHIRDGLRDIVRDVNRIIKVDEDYGSTNERPSLTLQSTASNDYLIKVLHNRNPKPKGKDKKPVRNINESYQCFRNSILAILDDDEHKSSTSKVSFLANLLDTFSRKFYLSIIIVNNKKDAFTIFETLNNRGKSLTTADLVKTHLLSLASNAEESKSFNQKWSTFSGTFNDDTQVLNPFLQEYWSTRSGRESVSDLYRPISQQIDTNVAADTFLNDLVKLKDTYYVMLYPTSKYGKDFTDNKTLLKYYNDLKQLGFKSYYPIPLAMHYHDFSEADILVVVHKILTLLTRFSSIVGNGGRMMGPNFVRTAKKIWMGNLADVQGINDYLSNYDVNDEKVTSSFKTWNRENASQKAMKYLLFNLEQYDDNDFAPEGTDFNDYNLIRLDEIDDTPINDKDEDGNYYSDYLGNFTIIEKNLYKQSKDMIEKRLTSDNLIDVLSSSALKHNDDIINIINEHQGEWKLEDIKQRQYDFQGSVAKIWK